MAKTKNRKLTLQFVEYLVSGGVYFWAGYGMFALLWSGLDWSLWWATIVSNVFGWSVNFLLQRYWVFKNKGLEAHQTQVTVRYTIITLTDFVLNYLILYGLQKVGITPYIGQFASAGFFTVWNYFWYRFWVFPEQFKKHKKQRLSFTPARAVAHRAHGHLGYHKAR